jgi:hypothetical protein
MSDVFLPPNIRMDRFNKYAMDMQQQFVAVQPQFQVEDGWEQPRARRWRLIQRARAAPLPPVEIDGWRWHTYSNLTGGEYTPYDHHLYPVGWTRCVHCKDPLRLEESFMLCTRRVDFKQYGDAVDGFMCERCSTNNEQSNRESSARAVHAYGPAVSELRKTLRVLIVARLWLARARLKAHGLGAWAQADAHRPAVPPTDLPTWQSESDSESDS